MPKLKTNKSAQKRMRISKKGKVKHAQAGRGHLLTGKSAKRKRHLGKAAYVTKTESKTIYKVLPYGA